MSNEKETNIYTCYSLLCLRNCYCRALQGQITLAKICSTASLHVFQVEIESWFGTFCTASLLMHLLVKCKIEQDNIMKSLCQDAMKLPILSFCNDLGIWLWGDTLKTFLTCFWHTHWPTLVHMAPSPWSRHLVCLPYPKQINQFYIRHPWKSKDFLPTQASWLLLGLLPALAQSLLKTLKYQWLNMILN